MTLVFKTIYYSFNPTKSSQACNKWSFSCGLKIFGSISIESFHDNFNSIVAGFLHNKLNFSQKFLSEKKSVTVRAFKSTCKN